ncbi:MAG TPA: RluA family pseudouridine synthase [Bacteroidales bacterium]|nr:RluA family pseudouridine synthase [Bacteroidales bacterium]
MKKFKAKISGTLLEVLKNQFPDSSGQSLRNMIRHSDVKRNGQPLRHSGEFVEKDDEIIMNDRPHVEEWHAGKKKISIMFEDDWLLVAHKPAGMLTSGESTSKTPTLVKLLSDILSKKTGQQQRLGIVHRIDREVEGLVMFAKSEKILDALKANWQAVEKNYLAITEKKPPSNQGEISSWLKDGLKQKMYSYDHEIPDSKWAVTHFSYVQPVGKYHLIEVSLDTGRKNQIRVHLSELGCPIVGDWKYGADKSIKRQIRLIAWRLAFPHPVTGERIDIEAAIPKRFYAISETEDEQYK